MKVKTPFKMIVPETIHQVLTANMQQNAPEFTFEHDDFALILNYLFHKENVLKAKIEKNKKKPKSYQDKELNEWFSINPRHLRKNIVCKSNQPKYISYLLTNDILITDDIYKPGEKSKYYKLNPDLKRDIGYYTIEPGTRQFDKMYKKYNNNKAHYNRLLPHMAEMKDKILNLEFNVEAAQAYIAQCDDITKRYFLTSQLESLADVRQRLFRRKWNKGRLYTNLTSLKKDFRQFVVGDFVQIDVKNSQPFLLNQLISHLFKRLKKAQLLYTYNIDKYSLPLLCENFCDYDLVKIFGIKALKKVLSVHQSAFKEQLVNCKGFARSVNTGMLYDDMVLLFKEQGYEYTRDNMKELMLTVFYSRNEIKLQYGKFEPYKKEKKLFYKAYPIIARVVELLKSKNDKSNATLSVLLQNIESKIIIDNAARELVEAGIVPFTIHDAIIVEREHQQKAVEIISAVYQRFFNTEPRLKIEDFGSGSNRVAGQQKKRLYGLKISDRNNFMNAAGNHQNVLIHK